jgi:imidazolonepropionase-like amidohydrolase
MRFRLVTSLLFAIVPLSLTITASAQDGEVLAIRAEKIIPVSGPEIANGVVLVRGGKIAAVGKDVSIPSDAKVLEAKVVMPGMVEAHTTRGMDVANENVPVVPFVTTADGLDPVHFSLEDALRDGITTLNVIQGNSTVIGGTGVIVKPVGSNIDAVMVKRPSAMKLSLQPGSGRNRMAQIAELRRAFEDYDEYARQLTERRAEQKRRGQPEEEADPRQEALRDVVEGRLKVLIYCPRDSDVLKAIEFIEQRKLKAALVLGSECRKSAPIIAKKGLSVVLDPSIVVWETDEEKDKEIRHVVPVYFQKAGVPFAFQVQGGSYGGRYLWYQAATAVSYGVPRDVALRAITQTPAEIIGMGDRVGSLQPGKDANILLLTGDPLDARTWVDKVIVEGKQVYDRASDTRLQKLLTGKEAR